MVYTDKRTLAGLTSGNTATYPHGLGKTPDMVNVRFISTLATNTNMPLMCPLADGSNVTVQNCGATTSPAMEVTTSVFHSLVV